MNKILCQIQEMIHNHISLSLPHVESGSLEKNGAVFYMNGKDGTEFDWYVNDKLPPFMVFYNDKENLGAAKLLLYSDGKVELYLYDEQGKKLIQRLQDSIDASEKDILKLAATLKLAADDKMLWNIDIEDIDTDIKIHNNGIREFKSSQKNYIAMKNKKNILNMSAYVSKKIIEEGWKVGYMERSKPFNEMDSGWFFAAGNEQDEYLSSSDNIALVAVGMVWQQLDPDIFSYIDRPVGTKLIRISQKEFETDTNDKEIYMVKR